MEQKVIEIARGVAKTSTFATKNEALRFAKSEGGAAIGIYENGGMYMFAFGAYKPQMVYSKLVYELKKAYNTGVHRTYTTDDGVFVAYMPLRKKMRRHGHGSPVPPPSTDIVFIGDENAALIDIESDLLWYEEDKQLYAEVFVKSTAYDKIAEAVIEIDGTQISVTEDTKIAIADFKEDNPSAVIPQGFGDSDYFVIYTADNVEDITEGDKAKVVLIDSEGEEFAQTNEKEIYIVKSQEIYATPTVDGEPNPVAVEAGYNAYYAVRLNTQARTCKLVDEDMNEIELTPAQALSTITEQTVEAVPEFADYVGWYYDVVPVTGTEAGNTYTLVYKADDEENDDLTLTIEE